jgi:putative FmdB family regulatory protein
MPLFSYQCKQCQQVVEKFQHSAKTEAKLVCAGCNADEFERLMPGTQNRVQLDARDNLHQRILPEAQRIQNDMKSGKDSAFLDIYGDG